MTAHLSLSRILSGRESVAIKHSHEKQNRPPPYAGVKVIKHDTIHRRMGELIEAGTENQQPIHEQRNADEKPDRNAALLFHHLTRR